MHPHTIYLFQCTIRSQAFDSKENTRVLICDMGLILKLEKENDTASVHRQGILLVLSQYVDSVIKCWVFGAGSDHWLCRKLVPWK